MPQVKAYKVDATFMVENVVIITTVFYNSGGYPKCEYFVMFPGTNLPDIGKSIGFNKRSFEEAGMELTDDFMHEEALNQAMSEIRTVVNNARAESGLPYTYSPPVKVEDVKKYFFHHWVRGCITSSMLEMAEKTSCGELSSMVYSFSKVKPVETKNL